jgi:hypothetical protein
MRGGKGQGGKEKLTATENKQPEITGGKHGGVGAGRRAIGIQHGSGAAGGPCENHASLATTASRWL